MCRRRSAPTELWSIYSVPRVVGGACAPWVETTKCYRGGFFLIIPSAHPTWCYLSSRGPPIPSAWNVLCPLLCLPKSSSFQGITWMKNSQPILTYIFSELLPSTTLLHIKWPSVLFFFLFSHVPCSVCLLNQIDLVKKKLQSRFHPAICMYLTHHRKRAYVMLACAFIWVADWCHVQKIYMFSNSYRNPPLTCATDTLPTATSTSLRLLCSLFGL